MKIQTTLAVVISIGTIVGGLVAIDAHYAKSSELDEISTYICKIETRLDRKIKQDRANALQERMWKLEDRYGNDAKNLDEYRRLKLERDSIIRTLNKGK